MKLFNTHNKVSNRPAIVIGLLSIYLLVHRDAWAYLDPGSGSMLFQALLAIVASASVIIGTFWKKIKLKISQFFSSKNNDSDEHKD